MNTPNASLKSEQNDKRAWHAYENGQTIGRRGPEGGTVLSDDELGEDPAAPPEDEEGHVQDARLTLERVPDGEQVYSATLYGWMAHTHTRPNNTPGTEIEATFAALKTELARLAALLPYEGDKNVEAKAAALNDTIADFSARFA